MLYPVCVCVFVCANSQYTARATGKIEEHVCTLVIEAKQERDGARERERERGSVSVELLGEKKIIS